MCQACDVQVIENEKKKEIFVAPGMKKQVPRRRRQSFLGPGPGGLGGGQGGRGTAMPVMVRTAGIKGTDTRERVVAGRGLCLRNTKI